MIARPSRSSAPDDWSFTDLSSRLKQRREDRGESLAQLAKAVGLSKAALARIEHSVGRAPRLDTAYRIAKHFGCKLEEI